MGSFSCLKSSDESSRKGGKGMCCCFPCCKSSNDKESSSKSSNDKESSSRKGRGMCCFPCFNKSSHEGSSGKGKKGISCFCCCQSCTDESSRGDKGKGCFPCTKSLGESTKGCSRCFPCCAKSSKESKDGEKGLIFCRCCAKSSERTKKTEKGTSCFHCCAESSKESRSGEKGTSCFSCTMGMVCFCSCTKSSEDKSNGEEKKKKKKKGCLGCCSKSSDHNSNGMKRMGCFHCCTKSSEESRRGRKCMACLRGAKSSERDSSKGEKSSCFSCFKSSCCWKSSKENESSSKQHDDLCSPIPEEKKKKSKWKACFCCKRKNKRKRNQLTSLVKNISFKSDSGKHRSAAEEILRIGNGNIAARVFTYLQLAAATQNFSSECLLGKGGFGKVYKGKLEDINEIVAVKQLDRKGSQGNREFLIEVLMLSLLHHQNLVRLLGYCVDGDQRILVYEYMPLGSLQDHLLDISPNNKPLDWYTRIKIATGAAKGLEYLHDIANPPVIYRDFKASNILLDKDYNPRLSDFGLAKIGPVGDKNHISTRVMGTYGYCAPEYALTGQLTKMSDIYSFGVVLLELITGKKVIDTTRPKNEQNLIQWAEPLFKDKKRFVEMADPLFEGQFPVKGLYQAIAIATMCLQEEASTRPLISDVVTALNYLATPNNDPEEDSTKSNSQQLAPVDSELPSTVSVLHTTDSDIKSSVSERDEEDMSHSQSSNDWASCSTPEEDGEDMKQLLDVTEEIQKSFQSKSH